MRRFTGKQPNVIVTLFLIGIAFVVFSSGVNSTVEAWRSRGGQKVKVSFDSSDCKVYDFGAENETGLHCLLRDEDGIEVGKVALDRASYRLMRGKPLLARRYGPNLQKVAVVDVRMILTRDFFEILIFGLVFVKVGIYLLRKFEPLKSYSVRSLVLSLVFVYFGILMAFLWLLVTG